MSNKLSDLRTIRILIGNVCVKSGKTIFQIFLNIFIWKQTQDIQAVALFNLIYLITHMVFFTAFAPIVKKGYRNFLHFWSLIGFAGVYLWIMYLGEVAIDHLVLIPFVIGFFNSIYWINFHNTQFDLTTHGNRGNFEGLRKSLRMTSSIIIPVLVGGMISLDYLGYGYQMAFGLGAAFFVFGAIVGMVRLEVENTEGFQFMQVAKKSLRIPDIRRSLVTYAFTAFSFSNSVIEVLIPIILFSYVQQEYQVGVFVSFFSIVSIIGTYLFGKFIPYKYYKQAVLYIGIAYAISLGGFVIFSEIYYLVIFSSFITTLAILFNLPQKVISDNVLHKMEGYKQIRSEYMVLREWFQAAGWIGSFLILYFLGSIERESVQIIFGIMVVVVFITAFILSKVDITTES